MLITALASRVLLEPLVHVSRKLVGPDIAEVKVLAVVGPKTKVPFLLREHV